MLDSMRPVWVIARREVRDQFRDWRITVPIILLTLLFPVIMNFTADQIVTFVRNYGGEGLLIERLLPFLFMVVGFFPITVSLVIALESFAGETERRSIEPLLSTPLADWQLYLGKLLAAVVTPLCASYLGTIVYVAGMYFTIHFALDPLLLVQILILSFVQTLVMVSGAVVVSTQTTSVRAANLLASFIIIPMALLVQGETVVMLWGQYEVLWLAILGQMALAALLVRTGLAHFNREELLGRELDIINLRASWQVFKRAFVGQAHSLGEWWTKEMLITLRRLLVPIGLTLVMMAVGVAIGAWYGRSFTELPVASLAFEDLGNLSTITGRIEGSDVFSLLGAIFVWLYNLRTILLLSFLGIFTFGVAGAIGAMATPAIVGFLAAAVPVGGISSTLFLAAYILPHGWVEIPAIILSGAAILRMGTTMVTPAHGQTISEAWLRSLADWARVMVGLAGPLFLIAALIEVFITPRVVILLMGGG